MRNAIIAIEDRRFYENSGVDVRGIGRALVQDVLSRKAAQGGSTIAQQFVKNALRAQSDRTVFQKMREAALAYHLTRKWPKSKILTAVPELDLLRQRRLRRRVRRAHLLRQPARPPGLRHARRPCASRSSSPRRPRSSPASWPTRRPMTPSPTRRRPWRGATSCSRTCSTRACCRARVPRRPHPGPPGAVDIKPPTVQHRGARTSRPGSASSSSTSSAPARRSRAG